MITVPPIDENDYCPECGWYIGNAEGKESHGAC